VLLRAEHPELDAGVLRSLIVAEGAVLVPTAVRGGGLAQGLAAVAGGVLDVEDHVGEGGEVEVVVALAELELPGALGARPLEGEVALVAEVELEDARVVLPAAGADRLDGAALDGEARVVVDRARRVRAVVVGGGGTRADDAPR